ncbi:hypothetical protein PoB_007078900 [Plakobranchus ocellatus]|uniref:Uncharacterized protein n=1 Tax=Plakobranchus ocellatus TaxID=259542 RepID=A0AAV4DJ92_9GAST|nr:hypothetical protein PoB_007078900 [Plakobranchus ocellatus]
MNRVHPITLSDYLQNLFKSVIVRFSQGRLGEDMVHFTNQVRRPALSVSARSSPQAPESPGPVVHSRSRGRRKLAGIARFAILPLQRISGLANSFPQRKRQGLLSVSSPPIYPVTSDGNIDTDLDNLNKHRHNRQRASGGDSLSKCDGSKRSPRSFRGNPWLLTLVSDDWKRCSDIQDTRRASYGWYLPGRSCRLATTGEDGDDT